MKRPLVRHYLATIITPLVFSFFVSSIARADRPQIPNEEYYENLRRATIFSQDNYLNKKLEVLVESVVADKLRNMNPSAPEKAIVAASQSIGEVFKDSVTLDDFRKNWTKKIDLSVGSDGASVKVGFTADDVISGFGIGARSFFNKIHQDVGTSLLNTPLDHWKDEIVRNSTTPRTNYWPIPKDVESSTNYTATFLTNP